MKLLNILFITLFVSFGVFEVPVGEAQYIEIVKGIGTVIQMVFKAKELIEEHNKQAVDEHAIQNEKLNNITADIQSLEKRVMTRLNILMEEVEKIPGETVTQMTASKFERYVQTNNQTFGKLKLKKAKVNRGELTLDDHFRHDVNEYKEKLEEYKSKLEVLLLGKELSVDFLVQVKNKANVCADRMTQVQLLNSFRALYVDTISRYLVAKHIVISLWESADKTSHDDKKRELNSDVRGDLQTFAERFQYLMSNASREFQLCDKPSSEYIIHDTAKVSRKCYFTGEGNLSNQIVKFGPFGLVYENKSCWDYVSLRPATARPGYVVVGAKFEYNVNILYIKLIEGKLLPTGIIDPKSISYNEANEPGIGEQVVKLHYRQSIVDLTETITPDNRVITGLKFALTDDNRIYLDVQSKEIDLEKGILDESSTRSEPHTKGTTQYEVRSFEQRNDATVRKDNGLQSVTPNQYLKFVPGGKLNLHPFFDLSDTYPTPLTLLSGASLYVRHVEGYQGLLSIRLHNFNIVPHVTKIDFDINEDFADVLKDI